MKRLWLPLATALGVCAASACRHAPPPAARGVLLVLAPAIPSGKEASRLAQWSRLRAGGRGFDAAFAPDPDPARARAALLGEGDTSLAALLRARGVRLAGLGNAAALPVDAARLDLSLPAGVAGADTSARLETWLRERHERFVVLAAVGGEPGAGSLGTPATLAGSRARELPRIATADLGFSAAAGERVTPPAWSAPARQRAEAAELERAIAADGELARLAELVERAAPGTAVVVVGDPRPDGGAHGVLERPDGLFEDTLCAAVVVSTPGLARPGRASASLVSTLDVAPTLVELLGLTAAPSAAAKSLMSLLADPGATARDEVLSSVPRRAGRLGRSLRTSRYRYTEWPDGSRELYDHDADPVEVTNLAARAGHQREIAALSGQLAARNAAPAAAPVSPRPSASRPRNVLLIVVDDLNTRVGAWGAPVKTPSIDRLAARGVRFEHAYVQVAMCSPSRSSMLTGWRPERTGVWQNEDPPRPPRSLPLQELFAAHGSRTISIGKIYHSPGDFRWDLRQEHPEVVEERDPEASGEGMSGLWVKAPGGDLDQPDGRRAWRAAQLVSQGGSRPWFLALGLVRPHVRWIAPERYFGLYPPESMAPVPYPADDLADVPAIAVKTQPQPLPGLPLLGREPPGLVADPSFRKQAMAAYQACVSFADAQVGVVLDALEKRGGFEDTLVVLLGDNGFHLGEHGGLLRKDTLFEEALRVPLVVAAPGLPRAGAVVKTPVEMLDLYPTILELAGLEAPADLDGQSLVPLLRDPDAPSRGTAVSYRRVRPPERGWSLRTERQRYTLWPDGSEELYDCPCTPDSENRAGQAARSAETRALRSKLTELVAGAVKPR